jgi:hypothetical protein
LYELQSSKEERRIREKEKKKRKDRKGETLNRKKKFKNTTQNQTNPHH